MQRPPGHYDLKRGKKKIIFENVKRNDFIQRLWNFNSLCGLELGVNGSGGGLGVVGAKVPLSVGADPGRNLFLFGL